MGMRREKYSSTGLLLSSADRGWSGLSAELRSHSGGIVAGKNKQPDVEISVDLCGNGSGVTGQAAGMVERAVAQRGALWLCPAGLQEDFTHLSAPVPRI